MIESEKAAFEFFITHQKFAETVEPAVCGFHDPSACALFGLAMRERITRDLVIHALTMAYGRRQPQAGLIVYSDRGSQYASHDYQWLLTRHGFLYSRSRKGDCYDNAAMGSFFHSLKVEQIQGSRHATLAKADVFEYIETCHNRRRRHSTLNYLSPCDFEA